MLNIENRFNDLSDRALSEKLKDYAEERKGEIADLCNAASTRITILAESIHNIREDEDDLR